MPETENLNPHWRWNWRARKKYLRNLTAQIKRAGYFENCNCAPCKLTYIFYDSKNIGEDIEGTDLFTGNPAGCSVFHCAPVPLTKAQADERVAYRQHNGEQAYRDKYLSYYLEGETL